jgi:hypothetical protein
MAGVQPVIKRCRPFAATAEGFAVAPRHYLNLNVPFPIPVNETNFVVYKRLEFVALVQDSFQLHLLSFGFGFDRSQTLLYQNPAAGALVYVYYAFSVKQSVIEQAI